MGLGFKVWGLGFRVCFRLQGHYYRHMEGLGSTLLPEAHGP